MPASRWTECYLSLLGLLTEEPTLGFLTKLTRAHLQRVPFENATSILRRAASGTGPVLPLDREAILSAWIERRSGGVCFEITDMFGALLRELGFEVEPLLAMISFPGSHQALRVVVDRQSYLCDVGNGAPFFEPIPLDPEAPIEFSHAGLAFRFRPDPLDPASWVQDRWIEGDWKSYCTYALTPAADATREYAYQRHHTVGVSWVVDTLRMAHLTDECVYAVRDGQLQRISAAGKTVERLATVADYRRALAELFGLPNLPIAEALAALEQREPAHSLT